MKASRYNLFFESSDGVTLAFNSNSGALAEIEKDQLPRIRNILKHPDQADPVTDKDLIDGLTAGGYLVGDAIDEVSCLQVDANTYRLSSAALSLTIAPTLACNFCCDYCYESQSGLKMSEDTQKALLEFADRRMGQSSKLLICWFGGEPTLCMPIIETLQNGLLELAGKHRIQVEPTSIISNGFLLDAAMARRMKEIGISEVQITIDGPPEVHDLRRKLRNGQGTFARILDNVVAISDILQVGIRINVDRDNTDDACRVIEIFRDRQILHKVKVYFAQVQSSGITCADIRDRCFGQEEFSKWQVKLYQTLIDRGIYHVDYPEVSGGITCGAVSNNSFVISPTGHIFKCWEELSLDPEKAVGSIFSSEMTDGQRANQDKFRIWNPFKLSECRKCDILPICMGGCPIHSINAGHPDRGACSPWKFNLGEMLELRHRCEQAREAKI